MSNSLTYTQTPSQQEDSPVELPPLFLGPPEVISDVRCELGESPVWDAWHGRLLWVDTLGAQVHVLDPESGEHQAVAVPEAVGCVVPHTEDTVIVALRHRVAQLHLRTGQLTTVWDLGLAPELRLNDGKCDPQGRLLVGAMTADGSPAPVSALYSVGPGGAPQVLLEGLRVSNGLTWSPDHATLYHIDTPSRKVMAYDYDPDTGQVAHPRTAVRTAWPDGMTGDAEGRLWVAAWHGSRVTVWDPRGMSLGSLHVPAYHVTSCAFGGACGTDLFITTARTGMTPEQHQAFPLSGALFRVRTRVTGLPAHAFGGPVLGGAG